MTKANIRESVQIRLGLEWITFNGIENTTIDDMIVDEYEKLIGDTKLLEGTFTVTGNGTLPYVEVAEKIFLVKRLHYGYTANSDAGDILTEISPLEFTGEYSSGSDPGYYWLQGMHRVGKQRIYFDQIPASGITIFALFYKFPDDRSGDNTTLEIKRLWAKAVKHIVAANVALIGRNKEQVMMRKPAHDFEMQQYNDTMRVINEIPKYPLTNATAVFTDA